ncbi:MAG: hypothetical protein ABIJ48_00725 [Actinomycetota bacterium]
MDGAVAQPEWDRLARLQRSLRSMDGGGDHPGAAESAGRGVRRRLARLALEDAIRTDNAEKARRGRREFEQALTGIVERVALRAQSAPPVPPAPAIPAMPVPAPSRKRVGAAAAAPATRAPVQKKAAATAVPPATPMQLRAMPVPAAAPSPRPAAPATKPKRARRPKSKPAPLQEFWSPGVVLGFRAWELRGRLFGAWKPWDRPEYEARCLSARTGSGATEVPHTDGRCGPPPCGLYCFKEPEQLLAAFGLPAGSNRCVLGLASLSGKVVEHERGYRSQKARVLAAAVVGRGQIVRIEGSARLRSLFVAPEATIDGLLSTDPAVVEEVGDPLQMAEAVIAYLTLARDFHIPAG